MNIRRVGLLATMALVVIAFSAPAVAQADVELSDEEQALSPGAQVTATSETVKTTTSQGDMECQSTLHLEVVANGPTHVTLRQLGAATTTACHLDHPVFTFPATVTDWTFGELTINTWGTAIASSSFEIHMYNTPNHTSVLHSCKFSGNVHFRGASPGSDTLNVGPSVLTGGGPECPTSGTIHGRYTLETFDGTRVDLDFTGTG